MKSDYDFDAVGNLIRDIHGQQFTFNGDNKQVEVRNSANQVVGEYKYDGLGKRTKKDTATEYVVFVYDGLGKLIGEYSADGPPAAPTVNYTATDPLGSPRVLTNKQGEVENSLEQSIGTYWYRVQGSNLGFEPLLTSGLRHRRAGGRSCSLSGSGLVATETRGFTPGYYLRHLRRRRNPAKRPQAG